MRKIIVCSFGTFSQRVCRFLERELPVKVTSVIDIRDLRDRTNREIREIVEEVVEPHVGEAEIIVIMDPLATVVALDYIKSKFPEQKFVGYGQGMTKMVRELKRVFVLVPERIKRLEPYQRIKAACQGTEICELDQQRWAFLVNRGWLVKEEAIKEASCVNGGKVVIYDNELLAKEQRVEEMVGWRGEVTDMKEEMLESLKEMMGLTGWK